VVYSVYLAILARGRTAYIYTVTERFQAVKRLVSRGRVRNMVYVVLYGADKAVIVYIVHSELYRIIILNNNYDYYSIDITASALYS
jgi:hypothetical protein